MRLLAILLKGSKTMIQMQTNLDVADNSGAKRVHVHQGAWWLAPPLCRRRRRHRGVGQGSHSKGKVKKGDVIAPSSFAPPRKFAAPTAPIRFDRNAAVLINKDEEPIGTRIFGPVVRELRASRPHEDHLPCAGGAVMSAAKIKKGDKVVILSGKDKGKRGEVSSRFRRSRR